MGFGPSAVAKVRGSRLRHICGRKSFLVAMFRAAVVLRPLARSWCKPATPAWRLAAPIASAPRTFATALGPKPKHADGTLEGRYATALFMASDGRLDKVYGDMVGLREMMEASKDFKLVIDTPGIAPGTKARALEAVCKSAGADDAVINFLKVLAENKRVGKLKRVIDLFEIFYRAEKGMVLCQVTSAGPLSSAQQGQVKSALQARAEAGSSIIMEYSTNPAIIGGLIVKMGDAIFDNSVSTRLERLQNQLLQPLE